MLKPGRLLELGQRAVAEALRAGAEEAEAFLVSSRSAEILLAGKIEFLRISSDTGLGIRAVLDKKIGMASTSRLEPKAVAEAAMRAVKIARVSKKDEKWHSLPEKYGKTRVKGLFDEETASLDPDVLMGLAEDLIKAVREVDPRVRASRGMLRAGASLVAICNSYGQEAFRRGTAAYVWIRASIEEAGRISTANEFACSRAIGDIDAASLGSRAARRALDFLKAGWLEAGEIDVVFRGQVVGSIISTMFGRTLTADSVQEGRSPWAGRLGQEVASEAFTLVDDGTLPGGYRSRELDDEGLPTQRTALIERGVLRAFLYDDYRAKREGARSTGNARRPGYGAPPSPSPNCLILAPGDWRFEELIADTRRGLYVVETIGEWLSDPVRGFLNANVTHGYLIKDGELTKPVSGVMMSCRFFEAMKGLMDAFCRELEESGGYYAPAVRIKGVSVSGK